MSTRQSVNHSIAGVGLVPRAVQLEFDKEEKKILQFETTNKKFYRDVKTYVEKIDDLMKNENKLMSNLSNLASSNVCSASSTLADMSTLNGATTSRLTDSEVGTIDQLVDSNETAFLEKLKAWKELSSDHVKSSDHLKQTCQTHVIEPMKNLNDLFPVVNAAIKKRETSYKELIKLQEKLEKAQEKERTGPNLVSRTFCSFESIISLFKN
jgi:hypothetical protein